MTEKLQYSYHAYGLSILSEFPINGFEPRQINYTDVYIHEGKVPNNLNHVINKGLLFQANDHEFLLWLDLVAGFYAHNGNEILVERMHNVSDNEISSFIIGTTFAALLHQRCQLPLHASTVIFEGKCLLFAGTSGSGKSTLAAALLKVGGVLVADDISVVNFSTLKPTIYPAFPCIKIWADSLKHLGYSSNNLDPVRGDLQKYYLPVNKFCDSSPQFPIHSIYILNTHNKLETLVIPLKGMDKFRMLKKHTFLIKTILRTGLELNHFRLVNRLASTLPINIIMRPNLEINTKKLVQIVSENL